MSNIILGSYHQDSTPIPPISTGTIRGTISDTTGPTPRTVYGGVQDDNDFDNLHRHIHYSPSNCWKALVPASATYDPSCSKALALAPTLRYLHAILAHTLIRWRESTDVVNTNNAYFLWSMAHGHVFDLAYFIALAIRHQTERHRKGVIFIGPYVTRLARYFGLFDTEIHHIFIAQFMRLLHSLTSLSVSLDLSSNVFSALITLMEPYIKFVSTFTSHRHSHLELATPREKVLYDCHVFLDHQDSLFAGHCGCETQPLPPPEYPPPISPLP
ncbi:hypothetical protein GOBAR_AA11607 [Gossypium barbadense]|uniref:Uncharacterized protein n=1 Tax=Gossypium barbadense TaxID=3634 RepID=A0A2P5Y0D0_GOSBA|nr:hypothetical protein GOBAR_AA11607 [Gossypium barbadense]